MHFFLIFFCKDIVFSNKILIFVPKKRIKHIFFFEKSVNCNLPFTKIII